jgi:hypothetical protein
MPWRTSGSAKNFACLPQHPLMSPGDLLCSTTPITGVWWLHTRFTGMHLLWIVNTATHTSICDNATFVISRDNSRQGKDYIYINLLDSHKKKQEFTMAVNVLNWTLCCPVTDKHKSNHLLWSSSQEVQVCVAHGEWFGYKGIFQYMSIIFRYNCKQTVHCFNDGMSDKT